MSSKQVDTPIGRLTLVATDAGIRRVLWEGKELEAGDPAGGEQILEAAAQQVKEYFDGSRRSFDLPLDLVGTPFQQKAWLALATIPFGETVSYAEQARRVGSPKAFRAVGAANGRNPVPIVLPCHRVIGSNGSLTGFGGGLGTKEVLLRHESQHGAPEV